MLSFVIVYSQTKPFFFFFWLQLFITPSSYQRGQLVANPVHCHRALYFRLFAGFRGDNAKEDFYALILCSLSEGSITPPRRISACPPLNGEAFFLYLLQRLFRGFVQRFSLLFYTAHKQQQASESVVSTLDNVAPPGKCSTVGVCLPPLHTPPPHPHP